MSLLSLHDHPYPAVQWGVVLGASLVAAFLDLRERRIPNLLTGPVFLIGLLLAPVFAGPAALAESFLGALMLAAPFVFLFVFAGGGAGDAKLMGAVGAWLGVTQGATTLAAVCFTGVVMALGYAARRRTLAPTFASMGGILATFLHPIFGGGRVRDVPGMLPSIEDDQKMPYGLAILFGVAIAAILCS